MLLDDIIEGNFAKEIVTLGVTNIKYISNVIKYKKVLCFFSEIQSL